jgi:hypothetical protein
MTAPTQATASEPVFRCDSIKLKRAIQARLYEEIKDMTWEQRHEYFCKGAEEFDRKVEQYRAERAAASEDVQ